MLLFKHILIAVIGGGDLASGVIYRLHRAGFAVMVTELAQPLLVRRKVSYGAAVFEGEVTIGGITARLVESPGAALETIKQGMIPVLADPSGASISALRPAALVDTRMAKRNLGVKLSDAPLVIGLGPGFTAGIDVHAVIETNRGHDLGRCIWDGAAEADTGTPGQVAGLTATRVLRSPRAGRVRAHFAIGERLNEGDVTATVAGERIIAPFDGILRGIIHDSVEVKPGMKIGDLDPRVDRQFSFTISDKALAIGGGALEAALASPEIRRLIQDNETRGSL